MKHKQSVLVAVFVLFVSTIIGCTPHIPKAALELRPDSIARRELQTRRFDTTDEKQLLSAGAEVLQDMGFQIDESETKLGVLVGSKNTDAQRAVQVVGSILLAAIGGKAVPWDHHQKVKASLISRPLNTKQIIFRITLQRIVWNTEGVISKVESIEDPELYQQFFVKLSKSVFLEAHEI